ncbi:putative apyrase 7 [Apostasia shenzhenica]|uniref:Putative apyrase 7 n=1 Tax=Apostasia shenzhenica TaxID=1088818 RepID=A0A2I0A5C9_9ASPA|nr:putative apyrase 7 [Apostasia shenzhenica]
MRLSASLQDLPAYTKLNLGEVDSVTDRNYTNVRHSRILQREGAACSFSKEKPSSPSTSNSKKWIRASIALAVVLLLFLFAYACSIYYRSWFPRETSKYYVILDCGSTSTRVYVYQRSVVQRRGHAALPFTLKTLPEVFHKKPMAQTVRAYQRMETEPGLHKLVHNETGLRAAIKPLLQWAEEQIPKSDHKTTSLFLYATAGVRQLPNSDSEWLLDKAWTILKKSSFSCHRGWVKIATGMEEAYYGWLALNYDKGKLGASAAKKTFGSLDLGGSSLQVTFETEKPVYDGTGINLSLGAVDHHLSAYSLPGYGLNDAFDKSVVYLLKRLVRNGKLALDTEKIELNHPCLHAGYKEEYLCSKCATLNSEGSPLIWHKNVEERNAGLNVKLLGAPHWDDCSALAKLTVNRSEWLEEIPGVDCKHKPCALGDGSLQPRGNFFATSGFFVVFQFFNLTLDASLDDIIQRAQEFCSKKWDVAKISVSPQPFIEQYCFRAQYIVSLLREGLHIRDKNVFIGSGRITWTLGVALLEASQALSSRIELSYRIVSSHMSPIILVLLVLMSVVLFCALSCVSNPMARFFRKPYLPLFWRNSAPTLSRSIPSSFSLPRWISLNSGDGRTKLPLSPTVACSEPHPFSAGYGAGHFTQPSSQPVGFQQSLASGSLLQLQFGDGTGSFWAPNRGQMLQSRRSQSREDLSSSLADAHVMKV